jgi:hypothetical protein
MLSPFPGMDPYLEAPEIWPSFHHRLANEIADQLTAFIGPKYYADIEIQTALEKVNITTSRHIIPDTGVYERGPHSPELREPAVPVLTKEPITISEAPLKRTVLVAGRTKLRSVKVFVTGTDELVTAIELLSPYNKRRHEGLSIYQEKRERILQSSVHFIEIDFLRGGRRPGQEVNNPPLDTDYVLLVNRNQDGERRISEIWPLAISDPLPVLPVPLLAPDPDAPLDLGLAVREVYRRARYDWRIDYHKPAPLPQLRPPMAEWIRQHLPEVGELA